MIFSQTRQFVFFAVPKTGTHSVREQLRPLLSGGDWEQQQLTGRDLSPLPGIAAIGHGHVSYGQLVASIGREHMASLFSFAFVRHPIERFMSACAFLARTDPSYREDPVAWSQQAFARDRFRARVLIKPQTDMLTNENGDIAVSFLGRYESLQRDMNTVLHRLGETESPLVPRNVTQEDKPRLRHDTGFIRDLEAFYETDFKLLGYDPG